MADSAIGSLVAAENILDADLFVLEQSGTAKKLSGATLRSLINRDLLSVTVNQLLATQSPTVDYDQITGALIIGIPAGKAITRAYVDPENGYQLTLEWNDGSAATTVGTVRGETGKSAYAYAVEQGYEGSETDFATLQINLYNASLNEDGRVQAEAQRVTEYGYMMDRLNAKMTAIDNLVSKIDASVSGTTLIITRLGTSVVDTTLMIS